MLITACAEILSLYPMPFLSLSSAQPPVCPTTRLTHALRGPPLGACHVYICVQMCVCVSVMWVSACGRVCACAFVWACLRACVRVRFCVLVCVCACVCVRASACVFACSNAMCLCACTYAGVCQRAGVQVSVCVFPFYLEYVDRNPTSVTTSLSQRRGFALACLGLEHLGYMSWCSRPPHTWAFVCVYVCAYAGCVCTCHTHTTHTYTQTEHMLGCMSTPLYVHVTHTPHTHTHTPRQGFAHVCLGLYVCTFCLCQWRPVCEVLAGALSMSSWASPQ